MKKYFDFFFGEEPFFSDQLVQKQINEFSSEHVPITTLKEQFDIDLLFQYSQNISLFSSKQIILLKDPWFLTKKCSTDEEKRIIDFFTNFRNPDVKLIIFCSTSLDQRRKIVSLCKKYGNTVISISFKDWEQDKILTWIKDQFTIHKKQIDQEALILFESMCGSSLQEIHTEIQTLLLYIGNKDSITVKDIHNLSGNLTSSFYQLGEAIKRKQAKEIFNKIQNLVSMNEDPIKIIGYLVSQYRLYFQLLTSLKNGFSLNDFAKSIKKNPYFIKQISYSLSKDYSVSELSTIQTQLALLDFQIKSGERKPKDALICWASSHL